MNYLKKTYNIKNLAKKSFISYSNINTASIKKEKITMSSKGINKFEYVRKFELMDKLLPNCWIVIRLDGKGFHKFSDKHNFKKPNDKRALDLMTQSAKEVMNEFRDVVLAYGQSDEYSFVLKKNTDLYARRSAKITTNFVSLFASSYTMHFSSFFEGRFILWNLLFKSQPPQSI